MCWDHWPIGWLNSQGSNVTATSLPLYPNHFSPMGMDFYALPNEVEEQGIYYSLYGVGGNDMEADPNDSPPVARKRHGSHHSAG